MSKRKLEDEINFKTLFKNPIRLFGWVYPLFFVLMLVMGIFYVKNLTQMSFNTQPVWLQDSVVVWQDIEEKKGGTLPAVDLATITNPNDELVAKGKELFDANCQSCHGAEGKGNGPAGAALNPQPRNFHQTDGWTNGRKFSEMYNTLQNGIIKNGMAAYEYIPPQDRIAIIEYLRTFADFPPVTEEEVAQMDQTYNLSKGVETPNQIPVTKAITLITEETSKKVNKEKVENDLMMNDNSLGYQLFSKYVKNKDQVASAFIYDRIGDFNQFVQTLQSDPVTLGFKAEVLSLNNEEMKELFDFMKSLKNT